MVKKIAIAFSALLLLVIVAVVGVFVYIDQIARSAVERGATYALGVQTTLGHMDVGVLDGRIDLGDLRVTNPPGFVSDHFLTLGKGGTAVALESLRKDTVEVSEISLSKVGMSLEKRGGKSNYEPIVEHLQSLSKESEGSSEPPPEETGSGKHFIVRKITIDDITVDVEVLPLGGSLTRLPIEIERIELKDIGTGKDNGVLLSELTGIVTKAILEAVAKRAGSILPGEIAAELNKSLAGLVGLGDTSLKIVGDVTATIGGEIVKVGAAGEQLMRAIEQGGKDIVEGTGKVIEGTGEVLGETAKAGGEVVEGVAEGVQKGAEDVGKAVEDVGKGFEDLLGKKPKKDKKEGGG